MPRNSFIFYRSYFEALSALNLRDRTAVYAAICEYALNGIEPSLSQLQQAIFTLIRPTLDKGMAQYENGAKGGRPPRLPDEDANPTETQPKPKDNPTITQNEPNNNPTETRINSRLNSRLNSTSISTSNNEDNIENYSNYYREIIGFLNKTTGTAFRWQTKDSQKHMHARLAEGFTVEDFKTVISKKTAEWKGTELSVFLRPETLFGTKFEGYLNQAVSNPKEKAPPTIPQNYTAEQLASLFHNLDTVNAEEEEI